MNVNHTRAPTKGRRNDRETWVEIITDSSREIGLNLVLNPWAVVPRKWMFTFLTGSMKFATSKGTNINFFLIQSFIMPKIREQFRGNNYFPSSNNVLRCSVAVVENTFWKTFIIVSREYTHENAFFVRIRVYGEHEAETRRVAKWRVLFVRRVKNTHVYAIRRHETKPIGRTVALDDDRAFIIFQRTGHCTSAYFN